MALPFGKGIARPKARVVHKQQRPPGVKEFHVRFPFYVVR